MSTLLQRRMVAVQTVLSTPPEAPITGLVYNPNVPISPQNEPWTCSVYAADWMLRSLGVASDDETLEMQMLAGGYVTPQFGLMDARGYGLAEVLRHNLPLGTRVEVNPEVSWAWLLEHAGNGPIALGGRTWNHWVGVRSTDGVLLRLANSANGHMEIWQRLSLVDFDRLGAWSAVHVPAASAIGPWEFWTVQEMARASRCPASAIQRNWPLLYGELARRNIADKAVQAAVIATTAIETASTFEPVREAFWLDEDWRRDNLRYYPYYGRGFIQLTWDYNYRAYIGEAGIANPDLALEAATAAQVMAEYFVRRGVAAAARRHDWRSVRQFVQGADAGFDRLIQIVAALGMPT